jgi:NAD(P)-dependent dehydrogenase (short-subunit alcohol dehydrogenase family)
MTTNYFKSLEDKVCVLTGGGGVIGEALALGLGSVGVKTAILDLNKEMAEAVAEKVVAKYSVPSIGVEGNVLLEDSLLTAKERAEKELGPVEFLINGAGGNSPKATTSLEQITPDDLGRLSEGFFGIDLSGFDFAFNLNFKGTLLPSMVFGKDMIERGSGSILNISSMSAFRPLTKIPAYSAAKSAVNSLTEWLSVHFGPTGVRVNAIAPGFFLTNQNRFLLTDEKTGELTPRGHKIISNTPMGRFGDVEELQGTVLYMLSDLSKFVTGVIIPVDGGFNAFSGV